MSRWDVGPVSMLLAPEVSRSTITAQSRSMNVSVQQEN